MQEAERIASYVCGPMDRPLVREQYRRIHERVLLLKAEHFKSDKITEEGRVLLEMCEMAAWREWKR